MKVRAALVAAAALLMAAPLAAQSIHGHPQKEAYASPAEWVPLNGQCWINNPNPLLASHIHVIPAPPSYKTEIDRNTYEIPITVQAHFVSGTIGNVYGEHIRSIKWDATGSTQLPVMKGIPDGVAEWKGVATVDHSLGDDGPDTCLFCNHIFRFPVHGWAEDRIIAVAELNNGRRLDTYTQWPVYSMIDPSAPEKKAAEQGRPGVHIRTACVEWANGSTVTGETITEISDYIPLDKIFTPFTTIFNGYNYTAPIGVVFPNQIFEQRKDPDLHHGVMGGLQRQVIVTPEKNKQLIIPVTIDPADLGTGDHKQMFIWTQPINDEAVSSVMAFGVTVGQGVPPPTLCTDPTAPNVGQPLPCLPPIVTPALCADDKATNKGQPLPCVFPPPVDPLPPVPPIFQPVFRLDPVKGILICQTADPATCMPLVK